jgi:hypothetical protein
LLRVLEGMQICISSAMKKVTAVLLLQCTMLLMPNNNYSTSTAAYSVMNFKAGVYLIEVHFEGSIPAVNPVHVCGPRGEPK